MISAACALTKGLVGCGPISEQVRGNLQQPSSFYPTDQIEFIA